MKEKRTRIRKVIQTANEIHDVCRGPRTKILGPDGNVEINGFDERSYDYALDVIDTSAGVVSAHPSRLQDAVNLITVDGVPEARFNYGLRSKVHAVEDKIAEELDRKISKLYVIKDK